MKYNKITMLLILLLLVTCLLGGAIEENKSGFAGQPDIPRTFSIIG